MKKEKAAKESPLRRRQEGGGAARAGRFQVDLSCSNAASARWTRARISAWYLPVVLRREMCEIVQQNTAKYHLEAMLYTHPTI
jgi:hypothetical protein